MDRCRLDPNVKIRLASLEAFEKNRLKPGTPIRSPHKRNPRAGTIFSFDQESSAILRWRDQFQLISGGEESPLFKGKRATWRPDRQSTMGVEAFKLIRVLIDQARNGLGICSPRTEIIGQYFIFQRKTSLRSPHSRRQEPRTLCLRSQLELEKLLVWCCKFPPSNRYKASPLSRARSYWRSDTRQMGWKLLSRSAL